MTKSNTKRPYQKSEDKKLLIENKAEQGQYSYVLNYGAGVNSTALLILLANGLIKDVTPSTLIALFADTGAERPETYEYMKIIQAYCIQKGIDLETVKAEYTMEEYIYRSGILPSRSMRWCTQYLKIRPIGRRASMTDITKPYKQFIGFDVKEILRVKRIRSSKDASLLFPLVELGLTRENCISIIKEEKLPVPEKSSCFCCPFQSLSRFVQMSRQYPNLADRVITMEIWTNLKRDGRKPFYLFREPVTSILERSDKIIERASRRRKL